MTRPVIAASRMMTEITLPFFLILSGPSLGAAISGSVVDEEGKPVGGVLIDVHMAGIRGGNAPYCPSCWLDCQKDARTDAQGRFTVAEVDDRLVFWLLVLAKGYEPQLPSVDPAKPPPKNVLKKRTLEGIPQANILRGKVVDPEGKPVAGAAVELDLRVERPEDTDLGSVIDDRGEFVFTSKTPFHSVRGLVKAESYARQRLGNLEPGVPRTVTLGRGASVTGRLM